MLASPTSDIPSWRRPQAAYLHIPFCAHHCSYCDFAVASGQNHLMELYLDALIMELAGLEKPYPVDTIFLGGGTPTYLNPDQLTRLLRELNHWLPRTPHPEFSIESTPDSLDSARLAILKEHGVTRVSVGVQSFQPHLLTALDRRHRAEQIPSAVEGVREHGMDLSLDLIFGIPGQTLAEWDADLGTALEYRTDHLSTYGLTYEKGTPLWKELQRGGIVALDEETELAMYTHAMDRLDRAGFEHYEISNFAQPGKRCRHNEIYWANEAYLGFGVGAARYVDGRRELNVRNTEGYIRRVLSGESPTFQREELPPRDRALETIAIQFRRSQGIIRAEFHEQTGFDLDELIASRIHEYVDLGLIEDDGQSVRLTREGKCVADAVITRMMA